MPTQANQALLEQSRADNSRAIELTNAANSAEIAGDIQAAYDMYLQIAPLLSKAIENGEKKSEERRRMKLHIQAVQNRVTLLRAALEGRGSVPDPLPSVQTIEREMTNGNGTIFLSLVEMGVLPSLTPDPSASPYLTPLLDPSLPPITYHIYKEAFVRYPNNLFFLHAKDDSRNQIVYTVTSIKHPRYQIPSCTMLRAGEYHSACAQIGIEAVRPIHRNDTENCMIGRTLTIATTMGKTIVDAPDRKEKTWTPRRFTYGGRRFVWKDASKGFNMMESLFEVKREWPKPGSKTGKIEEEQFERPLAWGETKYAKDKLCTLHLAGGMDQLFREFILASAMTRQLVGMYGHT